MSNDETILRCIEAGCPAQPTHCVHRREDPDAPADWLFACAEHATRDRRPTYFFPPIGVQGGTHPINAPRGWRRLDDGRRIRCARDALAAGGSWRNVRLRFGFDDDFEMIR